MSKTKIRCPGCSTLLAIDSEHAGKVIACPSCKNRMRVPVASSAVSPASPSEALPPQQTGFLDFPAVDSQPASSATRPAANTFSSTRAKPQTQVDDGFPSLGFPPTPKANSAFPSTPSPTAQAPTGQSPAPSDAPKAVPLGRSITGIIVAGVVAVVFSIIWVAVAALTSRELGILAWGIGGAIGLVAGAIARNPSPLFCGTTALVAVMSVLFAKVIMAAALMVVGMGANMMQGMIRFSPAEDKLTHAYADQLLADGTLGGEEKQYAELYTTNYFAGVNPEEAEEAIPEELYDIGSELEERWYAEVSAKTPEMKEQLLAATRQRHPEWIEDENHFLAVVESMLHNKEGLSDDLAAHAKMKVGTLEGSWDESYYQSVASDVISQRENELRKLAAERINSMDAGKRDQAVRETLQRHLTWNPYPDAYNAMMEKMLRESKFQGKAAEFATAQVAATFTDEEVSYFETTDYEEVESRTKELLPLINTPLAQLDAQGRAALIAESQARHPDWVPESDPNAALKKLNEAMAEIGTDGTFLGSLAAVFGMFDLLWIFLGATTAYSTAQKQGS